MNIELEKLRFKINRLDRDLLKLLSKRMLVAEQIGFYKLQNNLPIKDPKRESAHLKRMVEFGKEIGLMPTFVLKLFTLLFYFSCLIQKKKIFIRNEQ